MTVGALIIVFLVVEPAGLARLWQIGKQKAQGVAFPLLKVHTCSMPIAQRLAGLIAPSGGEGQ